MPKYTFACSCGYSKQQITSSTTKTVKCPDCGQEANRQMPKLSGQVEVRETVDQFGTVWKKDQTKMLEDRMREHFWQHEVPKMVESGIYEMSTMLENGWVYFDDKGQLHTRTAPPNKA